MPHPEHPLPGYAAGFDAGYLAGLLAASTGCAPPSPPQPMPEAAEGGAGASEGSAPPRPPPPPQFIALLEDFPDLFQKEVLERLDPLDRGVLGRTGSAVRTAVKRSDLPRVGGSASGPRVSISPFCRSLSQFVWAIANGCPWQLKSTCAAIAEGGQLEVLRWARAHGCPWDAETCVYAAEEGHLEVLQWAREQGCRWDEGTCSGAAQGGHLEVLRWAREHDCPWDAETCAFRRRGRAYGGVEMGAGARLHMG